MSLNLRHRDGGLKISWEAISLKHGRDIDDNYIRRNLPDFITRDYDIAADGPVLGTDTKKVIVPEGGWANLSLDDFEAKMGYRFRIETEQAMRGITRELAFLEFLESKGVARSTKLVEGLTLENFAEKMHRRFRMQKSDVERRLTREQAFQQWLKAQGYV